MLQDKKILLGISGSIAAYKIAFLTRLLIKKGAQVKVVMTRAATEFITPLTLSTLSKNPVFTDVASQEGWHNHVELGLWADALLVAPATANTVAKMANGHCDNMLLAVYLSARCPVFFAPAMDLDMWVHPATQANVEKLESYGNLLIPVEDGELASGLHGKGRMAEPEHIIEYLEQQFAEQNDLPLKGKTAIITSGPTIEDIDPVRFISNRSTGRMGTEIAQQLTKKGAKVVFISNPSAIRPQEDQNIELKAVRSAQEMYEVAAKHFAKADITVLAAAVADFTPDKVADKKIKKKEGGGLDLQLVRTKDIALELGKLKSENQINIGFALETNDAMKNAQRKLESKNLDMIVLNSLEDRGAGFAHNTNKVTFIKRNGQIERFDLKPKSEVAKDIVARICTIIKKDKK